MRERQAALSDMEAHRQSARDAKASRAVALSSQGESIADIARALGLHRDTVRAMLREARVASLQRAAQSLAAPGDSA